MAFGPIHWITSFVIFLLVLGIITWSAVHLGMKDHNSTDIVSRFLDLDDYLILEGHKSLPTEGNSSMSRVIGSNDDPTLFANHQGYEISDITEFYKVLQALSSTQNRATTGSAQNDNATAIFATSVVANDSKWSEDSAVTAPQSSDKPLALDNRQIVSETEIELQDRVSRPVATTHRASSLLDANGLRRTDRPVVDFLRDEVNVTSRVSAPFLPVHASSGARRTTLEEATRLAETTQPPRSPSQNELPGTSTPSHFYVTLQRDVTEGP